MSQDVDGSLTITKMQSSEVEKIYNAKEMPLGKFKQGAKPYESDEFEIKVGLPNNNGPIKPIGNIPGHHRIGSYQPVASSNHFQG